MVAIIALTGSSTVLFAGLGIALINVVVRRESARVAEKQIQTLVQASRSIANAVLDDVGACSAEKVDFERLRPLLAYTSEEFPGARIYLRKDDHLGTQLLPPQVNHSVITKPDWLAAKGFAGLVAVDGHIEIRNVAEHVQGECKVMAVFQLPLGSDIARKLAAASSLEIAPVRQRVFHVHRAPKEILMTIPGYFIPGADTQASVVLTVQDWKSGEQEDWLAYTVRPNYSRTFSDVSLLGRQRANWVWLLGLLSVSVVLVYAAGVRIGVRLSRQIVKAVNDLSRAASQIAVGKFDYRIAVQGRDQLADLERGFNDMAAGLERLQGEERARQRLEGEMALARRVQEHLFPRSVPQVAGATVAGRTQPARLIGGDLYDFFELGVERTGVLCADISGKGVAAALMMANLQAIARAHAGLRRDWPVLPPGEFVEVLNQELAGRFGDSRYATLVWVEYDARTRKLQYINAGNPPPILIRSDGEVERLKAGGFPIGMFGDSRYSPEEVSLDEGAILVIFTDGLTDTMNIGDEEFGEERLIQCCRRIGPDAKANDVVEMLSRAALEWSAGVEQFDDTTMVVMTTSGE